jgi:hypothetical protein
MAVRSERDWRSDASVRGLNCRGSFSAGLGRLGWSHGCLTGSKTFCLFLLTISWVNFLYIQSGAHYWWLYYIDLIRVHKLFDKIPKWCSVIILEVLIYEDHLELITCFYANAIENLNDMYTSCLIKFRKWCFVLSLEVLIHYTWRVVRRKRSKVGGLVHLGFG